MCKSLLSAKLHYIKSTFAANYKYLSYSYKICQDDWFMDINLLIGKIKVQFEKENLDWGYTQQDMTSTKQIDIECPQ